MFRPQSKNSHVDSYDLPKPPATTIPFYAYSMKALKGNYKPITKLKILLPDRYVEPARKRAVEKTSLLETYIVIYIVR